MDNETIDKKEQICKLLDIKIIAQSLLGSPEYINKHSKWNLVYKSFYKNENTPSLKISEKLQVFKCFATGSYGDVVKLYRDFMKCIHGKDLDIDSACNILISKFSLNINPTKKIEKEAKVSKKHRKISSILKGIVQYSNHELLSNNESLYYEYLEKRGIEKDSIMEFRLGIVNNSEKLTVFLKTKYSITMDELKLYGFYTEDEKFQLLNRIIVPIFDKFGKITSLSGRNLQNNAPKYKQISILTDSETDKLFFSANSYLYGLNLANTYIESENEVILVEGYFDVIRLFQIGVYNVLGIQTINLTEAQKKSLVAFQTKNIVVFFDGDITGQTKQKALLSELSDFKENNNLAYRSLWYIEEKDYIEQNSDPDTFFKGKSKDFVLKILNHRIDYRNYIIENAINYYRTIRSYTIEEFYMDVGEIIILYNTTYLKSIEEMVTTESKGKDRVVFDQLFYNDTEAEALWLMNELDAEFSYCELILKNAKKFIETFRKYEDFLNNIRIILLYKFEESMLSQNTPKKTGRSHGNNRNKSRIDVEDGFDNILYTFELDYIKGILFFFRRFSDEEINGAKRNDKNFFDVKVFSKIWCDDERQAAIVWIKDYFEGVN